MSPNFYKPVGASRPERIAPHGPGLVLGGGGLDVNAGFVWIHDTIVGSHSKRGADLVVLRATGDNDYDRYIYRLAPFHSVRTLLLPTCSSPSILLEAARIVAKSTRSSSPAAIKPTTSFGKGRRFRRPCRTFTTAAASSVVRAQARPF